MKLSGETAKSAQMTAEEAWEFFLREGERIREIIEEKIEIYKPLDVDEALEGFLDWIKQDDFSVLRTLPEAPFQGEINDRLEELIRHYLIEQAYYKLEERFIKKRLKKKFWDFKPDAIKFMEMVDFVIERIERKNFARIKSFRERCSFQTYLATSVSSIVNDFWRSVFSAQKNVKKYVGAEYIEEEEDGPDGDGNGSTIKQEIPFAKLFQKEPQDPYDVALKKEYGEFLPEVLGKLDKEQLLALKLKYGKEMNITLIARTLGKSRYKTEQFIKKTELFIKKEIMLKLKKKRRQR